jgi:hypothetical protein
MPEEGFVRCSHWQKSPTAAVRWRSSLPRALCSPRPGKFFVQRQPCSAPQLLLAVFQQLSSGSCMLGTCTHPCSFGEACSFPSQTGEAGASVLWLQGSGAFHRVGWRAQNSMCGGVGLLVPAEQWHIESACVGAAGVLSFRHRAAGYRATEGEAVKPPCAWGNEASGTCGRAEFRTCLCRRVGFQCVSGSGVAGHGAAGNCRMMECGASVCAGKQGFPGQSEVGHGASRNGGAGNVYLPTILFVHIVCCFSAGSKKSSVFHCYGTLCVPFGVSSFLFLQDCIAPGHRGYQQSAILLLWCPLWSYMSLRVTECYIPARAG